MVLGLAIYLGCVGLLVFWALASGWLVKDRGIWWTCERRTSGMTGCGGEVIVGFIIPVVGWIPIAWNILGVSEWVEEQAKNRTFRQRTQWLRNIIGFVAGYCTCSECGKNTMWAEPSNPGIMTSPHGGRIICTECYLKNKDAIELRNHRVMSQITNYGGYIGYSICSDPNCSIHRDEFKWSWNGKQWEPPEEIKQRLVPKI